MPYIKPEDRQWVIDNGARTAGELNYLITYWSLKYLKLKGEKYQTYNDIVGALEGAKLELYRRHVSQYEDEKIDENGDVVI